MAILIANENGDWWEFQPGESLYILNTDELTAEMESEILPNWGPLDGSEDYPDKLEKLIWQHGYTVPTGNLFPDK
jgi:hypothetical protein